MQKRQYIFLGLMIILFYLSLKIIHFEYKKYTISGYIKQQEYIINDVANYLEKSNDTLKYINTPAFKNKILKGENGKKMKGEEVIILTSETIYNKFSGRNIIENTIIKENKVKVNMTSGMTNFEKWIYFLLNKDIR
ncbi:MAG: hypothetical protein Q9M94_00705 [Candidatus Gracilibacteria bacterium]|nr:hypothetical protein [Candidatus Gracilibacteria bacterium]MDQ7023638.1 hypothetical protein [Candidatus Gracilibacteria bacterium]